MTLMTNDEFSAAGGARCPNCQSEDIDRIDQWTDEESGNRDEEYQCADCGYTWTSHFKLLGYTLTTKPGSFRVTLKFNDPNMFTKTATVDTEVQAQDIVAQWLRDFASVKAAYIADKEHNTLSAYGPDGSHIFTLDLDVVQNAPLTEVQK